MFAHPRQVRFLRISKYLQTTTAIRLRQCLVTTIKSSPFVLHTVVRVLHIPFVCHARTYPDLNPRCRIKHREGEKGNVRPRQFAGITLYVAFASNLPLVLACELVYYLLFIPKAEEKAEVAAKFQQNNVCGT